MADGAFTDDGLSRPRASARLGDLVSDLVREVARRSTIGMIGVVEDAPRRSTPASPARARGRGAQRERILAAAAELVAERGIDRVSMDDVARAACVGTGTLYRRFGDRAASRSRCSTTTRARSRTRSSPARRRSAPGAPAASGCTRSATATSTCSSATPTSSPPRCRRTAGRSGRPAVRDAPRDPAARGGAAPRPRVHRAGDARDAAPGAPPLRARGARVAARAAARRVARARRRGLCARGCRGRRAAEARHERASPPTPDQPVRRGRRARSPRRPGPSMCSTLADREARASRRSRAGACPRRGGCAARRPGRPPPTVSK